MNSFGSPTACIIIFNLYSPILISIVASQSRGGEMEGNGGLESRDCRLLRERADGRRHKPYSDHRVQRETHNNKIFTPTRG